MAASQFPHPRTRIKETIFDIADRVRQVKRLKMMLEKNVDELKTIFSEEHASMIMMADDIDETIEIVVQLVRNINAWSQHESAQTWQRRTFDLHYLSYKISRDPRGEVLIISECCLLQHMIVPLAAAMMGGNTVVFGCMALNEKLENFMSKKFSEFINPEWYKFVRIDEENIADVIKSSKFDHIHFSGSDKLAQVVREAAASDCTIEEDEMNAHNFCFLGEIENFNSDRLIIMRIEGMHQKRHNFFPNIIFCTQEIKDKFLSTVNDSNEMLYILKSLEKRKVPRDVFEKAKILIQKSKVEFGGSFTDDEDHDDYGYLEPTILTNVDLTDDIFKDEISAQIVVIVEVKDAAEAAQIMNEKFTSSKSLWIYTDSDNERDAIITNYYQSKLIVNARGELGHQDLSLARLNCGKILFDEFTCKNPQLNEKESFSSYELRNHASADIKSHVIMGICAAAIIGLSVVIARRVVP